MSYASTVLADNPVGYWKFNEGGGTTIIDYGSAGLNLTTHAAPTMSNAGPLAGETCMTTVSASLQYADVPDPAHLFQNGDVFTYEIWYKRSAVQASFQDLIAKATSAGEIRFVMQADDTVGIVFQSVGVPYRSSGTITDTVSFHHLVATKNGSARFMYVDAVDVTVLAANQTFGISTSNLNIARRGDGNEYLDGSVGHAAIYSTALAPARVTAHFQAATASSSALVPGPAPLLGRFG